MEEILMRYNYFVSVEEAKKAVDPFVESLLTEKAITTQNSNESEVEVA